MAAVDAGESGGISGVFCLPSSGAGVLLQNTRRSASDDNLHAKSRRDERQGATSGVGSNASLIDNTYRLLHSM